MDRLREEFDDWAHYEWSPIMLASDPQRDLMEFAFKVWCAGHALGRREALEEKLENWIARVLVASQSLHGIYTDRHLIMQEARLVRVLEDLDALRRDMRAVTLEAKEPK